MHTRANTAFLPGGRGHLIIESIRPRKGGNLPVGRLLRVTLQPHPTGIYELGTFISKSPTVHGSGGSLRTT